MITPGSVLHVDLPFQWYVIVREKEGAKKQYTYWINGNHLTREAVAEHVAKFYRHVQVITIDRATAAPSRTLMPIPPEHFQSGAIKVAMGEEETRPAYESKWKTIVPLSAKPLSHTRKPLWQRPL